MAGVYYILLIRSNGKHLINTFSGYVSSMHLISEPILHYVSLHIIEINCKGTSLNNLVQAHCCVGVNEEEVIEQ